MYKIILACHGIPAQIGLMAVKDIAEEFTHRPWHHNVICEWDGSRILLQAENDFDSDGLALLDEFGDVIIAYISEGYDGRFEILSVTET